MDDLNDYQYFVHVVAHGGFASAGRALGIPKSKLSRRVSELEKRLDVRLIERSSRSFEVTDIGQAFFDRCQAMLEQAEAARSAVTDAQTEPQGPVRVSVPLSLINGPVGAMLPAFLERFPRVRLHILATDRRVDVVNERMHLALRARTQPDADGDLTMRLLCRDRRILLASPGLAGKLDSSARIADLNGLPTVSLADPPSTFVEGEVQRWELENQGGQSFALLHTPRLVCRSGPALLHAIRAGLGVGLMMRRECAEDLRTGAVVRIFPEWSTAEGSIYAVFPSGRSLPPATRALVEHLVQQFRLLDTMAD